VALGGGTFVTQNKILPGAYINFVSASVASEALSDRGIASMPLELDWGVDSEVFEVSIKDFTEKTTEIFGYTYDHEKMKGLRELFNNIHTLYAYKLTSGGEKAKNIYATAKYSGIRGNDLKVIIQKSVDDNQFIVKTLLDTLTVDEQTVNAAIDLKENDFLTWNTGIDLIVTAATPLEGGINGVVTGQCHQNYLNKIEAYAFNALGVVTTDDNVKSLYTAFTKRLRDDMGIKFQTVLFCHPADYIGIVNIGNKILDSGWNEAALVYWVTGVIAGCEVNKSNMNKIYDGVFTIDVDYTQTELENAIKSGKFILHKVGKDIRVLEDINSLITTTDTLSNDFKSNQVIRVCDQIGNDIAILFNDKYLGAIPNNEAGRISLWSDIVKHHEELQRIGAIEDFSDANVIIMQGDNKKTVVISDSITPINAMGKLYMTVTVA